MTETPIMNLEQQLQYTRERKLFCDTDKAEEQMRALRRIVIHNGFYSSEIEADSSGVLGAGAVKYHPLKSMEPHYFEWDSGTLHVVNTRGKVRLIRDFDQAEVIQMEIQKRCQRDVGIFVNHYQRSSNEAAERFRFFARELVENQHTILKRNNLTEMVKDKQSIDVIIGPKQFLPSEIKLVEQFENSEFLESTIGLIDGKPTLLIDYIFGDQAHNVLEILFSLFHEKLDGPQMNVYHFGKVGGVSSQVKLGDIVIPTGYIPERIVRDFSEKLSYDSIHKLNETYLNNGFFESLPLETRKQVIFGPTMDSQSVLRQKLETFSKANKIGVACVDMEWLAIITTTNMFKNFTDGAKANLSFAGVVSDKPLAGKTLADTEYDTNGLYQIAKAYVDYIARN